jgi:hypothetical protein
VIVCVCVRARACVCVCVRARAWGGDLETKKRAKKMDDKTIGPPKKRSAVSTAAVLGGLVRDRTARLLPQRVSHVLLMCC